MFFLGGGSGAPGTEPPTPRNAPSSSPYEQKPCRSSHRPFPWYLGASPRRLPGRWEGDPHQQGTAPGCARGAGGARGPALPLLAPTLRLAGAQRAPRPSPRQMEQGALGHRPEGGRPHPGGQGQRGEGGENLRGPSVPARLPPRPLQRHAAAARRPCQRRGAVPLRGGGWHR